MLGIVLCTGMCARVRRRKKNVCGWLTFANVVLSCKTMKVRKTFKKDEALGIRIPRADLQRLEREAEIDRRNKSDFAWVLIAEGLDRREAAKHEQKGGAQ
jgi:hypothetical protein